MMLFYIAERVTDGRRDVRRAFVVHHRALEHRPGCHTMAARGAMTVRITDRVGRHVRVSACPARTSQGLAPGFKIFLANQRFRKAILSRIDAGRRTNMPG